MTMLDALDDEKHIEQILEKLPKYRASEAQELNKKGELADGVVFQIDDSDKVKTKEEEGEHWVLGVFINGKMPYVNYDLGLFTEKRLEQLKRKAIASLLNMAESKWIPTAKYPWMPQKYINADNGKALFTPDTTKNTLEDAVHDNEVIDTEFHPKAPVVEQA